MVLIIDRVLNMQPAIYSSSCAVLPGDPLLDKPLKYRPLRTLLCQANLGSPWFRLMPGQSVSQPPSEEALGIAEEALVLWNDMCRGGEAW